MELLVLILKKVSIMDDLMRALAKGGIKGATIVDGEGMGEALINMEDLPMFGLLRRVMEGEEKDQSKVIMFILDDEKMITARNIIKDIIGDINAPNTGIMFAMPVTYAEGIGE